MTSSSYKFMVPFDREFRVQACCWLSTGVAFAEIHWRSKGTGLRWKTRIVSGNLQREERAGKDFVVTQEELCAQTSAQKFRTLKSARSSRLRPP